MDENGKRRSLINARRIRNLATEIVEGARKQLAVAESSARIPHDRPEFVAFRGWLEIAVSFEREAESLIGTIEQCNDPEDWWKLSGTAPSYADESCEDAIKARLEQQEADANRMLIEYENLISELGHST